MNSRDDMVRWISNDTSLPRSMVKAVLDSLSDYAEKEIVERGEFSLKNICTFHSNPIQERYGTNPMTGERQLLPATRRLTIKASHRLRKAFHKSLDNGTMLPSDMNGWIDEDDYDEY